MKVITKVGLLLVLAAALGSAQQPTETKKSKADRLGSEVKKISKQVDAELAKDKAEEPARRAAAMKRQLEEIHMRLKLLELNRLAERPMVIAPELDPKGTREAAEKARASAAVKDSAQTASEVIKEVVSYCKDYGYNIAFSYWAKRYDIKSKRDLVEFAEPLAKGYGLYQTGPKPWDALK